MSVPMAIGIYLILGALVGALAWEWLERHLPEEMSSHRGRTAVRVSVPFVLLWPGVLVFGLLLMSPIGPDLSAWVNQQDEDEDS